MKLPRDICLKLAHGLCNLEDLTGATFAYAVGENKDTLIPLVQEINAAAPSKPPEFEAYEAEVLELFKSSAEKDENGDPKFRMAEGTTTYIVEDSKLEETTAAFEALKEKHADAIAVNEAASTSYLAYLNEKVEIGLCRVALADVPAEITEAQMYPIRPMISVK